jgi:hypothetical protein
MLKTTRQHCKKLMQVSIDSEINSNDFDHIFFILNIMNLYTVKLHTVFVSFRHETLMTYINVDLLMVYFYTACTKISDLF